MKLSGVYLQQFIIVVVSAVLLLVLGGWSIASYYTLSRHTEMLIELDSIKTQVTNANIYIRNASLTPSIQERENELFKIFKTAGTLQTALKSFANLDKLVSGKTEHNILAELNDYRINHYRPGQKTYLRLVRNNESDTVLWTDLKSYQAQQFEYVRHIDIMYQHAIRNTGDRYKLLLQVIILAIIGIVIFANYYVNHIYCDASNRVRSCWLCGEPLLSRLSLNMTIQDNNGKERFTRVCSACYINNQEIL